MKPFVFFLGTLLALGLYAADSKPAPAASADTVDVTFKYTPTRREAQTLKEVNLAGEFNTWDAFATEMKKGEDGVWSVTVKVKKGKGQWKLLLNGNWVQNMEPLADRVSPTPARFVNDPYGGKNCENDF
jgi:hypothetical protein